MSDQNRNPIERGDRRTFLKGATAVTVAGLAGGDGSLADEPRRVGGVLQRPSPIINVRDYGAKGDGVTNDTYAFAQASAYISSVGTGTLLIPPGKYIVGKQASISGGTANSQVYKPDPIIQIQNCRGPVLIEGQSGDSDDVRVVLRAADGLRFGSFDPATGAVYNPALPFTDIRYRADAYTGMIELRGNSSVTVRNIDLDGNLDGLALGGLWGDTGRQCGATGIYCDRNTKVTISNVLVHHHGLDGVQISNPFLQATDIRPHSLQGVVSRYNARNALSWVGGSGLSATSCKFSHSGRGRFHSSPAGGVDIEPEDTHMQSGIFEDCEIIDNLGLGVGSDNTNSAVNSVSDVAFRNCQIVGTTYYSLLVRNPGFLFQGCRIVGAMTTNPGSVFPASSIRFVDSHITDVAKLAFAPGLLIDCSYGSSTAFDRCVITSDKQRLANVSSGRITRTKFEVKLPVGFFPQTDWVAIVVFSTVDGCTFDDAFPTPAGPRMTINYAANPTFSADIRPNGSRLAFLFVG